jgi:hypothetical protein
MRLALALAVATGALVSAGPVHAQATPLADKGTLLISLFSRPLGTENFVIETHGDSLVIGSETLQVLPTATGADTLRKIMRMVLMSFDYDLKVYESHQRYRGSNIKRAVVPHDTTYTVYRESSTSGVGDAYARPPGRMFVLDGQLFTSFDLVCRSLKGRAFEKRPLWMLVLSTRDSMIEVTATDLGPEPIQWGGRTVQARKMTIADAETRFVLWMGTDGRMLRLEQQDRGLRVDREPPEVKPATKRAAARKSAAPKKPAAAK